METIIRYGNVVAIPKGELRTCMLALPVKVLRGIAGDNRNSSKVRTTARECIATLEFRAMQSRDTFRTVLGAVRDLDPGYHQ